MENYTKYKLKAEEELAGVLAGTDKIFVLACNKCFKEFETLDEPDCAAFVKLAAEQGKTVIILESQPLVGGNSIKATGGMNAAKTAAQDKNEWKDATTAAVEKTIAGAKANYPELNDLTAKVEEQFNAYKANPTGYFDSTELFALDTMVGGKGINNLDLVMTMVNNSAEAIDWLATTITICFC